MKKPEAPRWLSWLFLLIPQCLYAQENEAQWVHRFAVISDTQIADKESPARAVRIDRIPLTRTAWRPQEAYGLQTLDATIRAINHYHQNQKPLDFVIHTGDVVDNAQFNELRWFIDTMDGKLVLPDSGAEDGGFRNIPREDNPSLAFQAEGLKVPWFPVLGNHDVLAQGTLGIRSQEAPVFPFFAWAIGLQLIDRVPFALKPLDHKSPAILLSSEEKINQETLQLNLFNLKFGYIPPDPNRRYITRKEFIQEHFNTTTSPLGHGFSEENLAKEEVWYLNRPSPFIPVRLLVLDTVVPNPPLRLPVACGTMSSKQFFDFVKPQIEDAQQKGEYVILASHHSSSEFEFSLTCPVAQEINKKEFRDFLTNQPNIVAHLVGHSHRNSLEIIKGKYSYPEITTGSIIDYPQETRILEVSFFANNTSITIKSQMIAHMEYPTRLSAESFRRAEKDCGQIKTEDNENQIAMDGVALKTCSEAKGKEDVRNFVLKCNKAEISNRDCVIVTGEKKWHIQL